MLTNWAGQPPPLFKPSGNQTWLAESGTYQAALSRCWGVRCRSVKQVNWILPSAEWLNRGQRRTRTDWVMGTRQIINIKTALRSWFFWWFMVKNLSYTINKILSDQHWSTVSDGPCHLLSTNAQNGCDPNQMYAFWGRIKWWKTRLQLKKNAVGGRSDNREARAC